MKTSLVIVALIALPVGLSGCDQAPNPAAPAAAMSNMAMPEGTRMGKGVGIITAIDAAAGKITLDHEAIPAVGWPAMKMGFSAKPERLKGIAVGDKVNFDMTVTGSTGEVTAIRKQ